MNGDDMYNKALKEVGKENGDIELILSLLNKAIEKGSLKASYALGTWYLHGNNVEKDLIKAVDLLEKASKGNIPEACFDLAVCYETGEAVTKDENKAFKLYLQGALWGDKQSCYEVGRCYYYGVGITEDKSIGDIWLDRAEFLGIKEEIE